MMFVVHRSVEPTMPTATCPRCHGSGATPRF